MADMKEILKKVADNMTAIKNQGIDEVCPIGIIDIENYRAKREDTLIGLSHKLAAKARKTGQKVVLEPMNPQERRIIHMALQNDRRVSTYSEGEEPYRKVVIVPEVKENSGRKDYHSKQEKQA